MTIGAFLHTAVQTLNDVGSMTARLDVLVLLGDALGKDKSWLLAHLDATIPKESEGLLQAQLTTRAARKPLAYIRGHQEFYGREFIVNPDVLIPRPETEMLVDIIKTLQPTTLLDVGTGSGAIAITAAFELPQCVVAACDISTPALTIAKQNAAALSASVAFFESDLVSNTTNDYQMIVANLPYVDVQWERSIETSAEPPQALFASDNGLALIKRLIDASPARLTSLGYLLLEADPRQHATITAYAKNRFTQRSAQDFMLLLKLS